MDFAEQIRLLQQAGDDPEAVAVATLDIYLSSRDEQLRRVIEAASIPHWFDSGTLKTLLDDDLRQNHEFWLETLKRCPMVERFPSHGAFCIHKATRLGLRKRMAAQHSERFMELTKRAAASYPAEEVRQQIETLFHRLVLNPGEAGDELRQLEYSLRGTPEDALALAVAFEEYTDTAWPPLVRAWVYWLIATVREPYSPVPQSVQLAESAVELCSSDGLSPIAIAAACLLLGDLLFVRGQSGDADRALAQFEESLRIRERLYEANPNSAAVARDAVVSHHKLMTFGQRTQHDDLAIKHRKACFDLLDRCISNGMQFDRPIVGLFEWLRSEFGDPSPL